MRNLPEWLSRIVLILFGTGVALAIVYLVAPSVIATNRARFANIDLGEVEYKVGNGDLFVVQWGSIAAPDNPYEVLSRHPLAWDADGFRVPAYPSDSYKIVALGDSLTEAGNVAFAWPDVVAHESGQAVRNLGFRGYGPQEEALVMQEYGAAENPEVVIIGFFGGNDISNAESFQERSDAFILPELARDAATVFNSTGEPWNSNQEFYQYPVYADLNGILEPIAFFNSYTSWLTVPQDDLRASYELKEIRQSWADIRAAASEDTCIIIAYLPSKSHIYIPLIVEENRATLVDGQAQRLFNESDSGISRYFDKPPTYEQYLERRNNIAIVLGEVATEDGFYFVDLSPYFDEAAAQGQLLYYRYDTHMNQSGHDLAGKVIAEYMQKNCESA